jgi:hypothetical protein
MEFTSEELWTIYLALCLADNEYRKQFNSLVEADIPTAAESFKQNSRDASAVIDKISKETGYGR